MKEGNGEKNRSRKERLELLRITLKLSVKELSEILEIKPETVYWYLSTKLNDSFINKHKIKRLVEKTGVNEKWLLEGEGTMLEELPKSLGVSLPGKPTVIEVTIDPNATEIHIILHRG